MPLPQAVSSTLTHCQIRPSLATPKWLLASLRRFLNQLLVASMVPSIIWSQIATAVWLLRPLQKLGLPFHSIKRKLIWLVLSQALLVSCTPFCVVALLACIVGIVII